MMIDDEVVEMVEIKNSQKIYDSLIRIYSWKQKFTYTPKIWSIVRKVLSVALFFIWNLIKNTN